MKIEKRKGVKKDWQGNKGIMQNNNEGENILWH